jgi:hypothetical protein
MERAVASLVGAAERDRAGEQSRRDGRDVADLPVDDEREEPASRHVATREHRGLGGDRVGGGAVGVELD